MRITHVVENLNRGGLERVVVDLATEQKRRGHDIQVICLFEEGTLGPEIKALGIPLISCRKQPGAAPRALWAMRKAIQSHQSEIVHSHNAMAHYYAVSATLLMKVGRISTRHGMADHPFLFRQELFYRISTLLTDVCAVVCDRAKNNFVRYHIIPSRKAVTVYNGIPLDAFGENNASARNRLMAEVNLPVDSLLLGTVGRLTTVKSHETLLKAMPAILEKVPHLMLVVIGGGALFPQLLELRNKLNLTDKVFFLGDRSDVKMVLAGFDMFALSSITEGYSIALVEACACSLPIVATNVGGNSEIVKDRVGGILVPANSPEKFAIAVIELALNKPMRVQMGKYNRKMAEKVGSVGVMSDRYDVLYSGTLAASRAGTLRRFP